MFRIPLARPWVTEEVKRAVCQVLESGMLTEGQVTRDLEETVAGFVGCREVVAVTSCTTGMEMVLRALGIGPGDEVIVPDFTYPATADAVASVGGTIVIVDCDPETMNVDYPALDAAIGPRTRALLPVSLFGNPLDGDRLADLSRRAGTPVVEDAACSLGATFGGRRVGGIADVSVFSLHPRKPITSGEGGLVCTDDGDLAERIRSSKRFGMRQTGDGRIEFASFGTNAKLSDIQAAVALVQMRHVEEILTRRLNLAERYDKLLQDIPGVTLPRTTPGGVHSYQSYCVLVEERDRVLRELREGGIEVQIGTYALHREPAFRESTRCRWHGPFSGSRHAFEHALSLPLFHDLGEGQQREVVSALARAVGG